VVYDAHTLLASELPSYGLGLPRTLKHAIGERLDRWLPARADHVIAVSERIGRRLVEDGGLPGDRVSVVSNGLELSCFGSEGAAREGGAVLVYAGNLAPYQGIDLLLAVLRDVASRHPRVRLRIVTDGSFSAYEGLARNLGVRDRIEIVEARLSELPDRLAECDIAVNPRRHCDGTPQKLLNYMAAGLPIVSFADGGSTIRHLETGWVVQGEDSEAFVAAVTRLLDDPGLAASLGAAARRHALATLSWDAVGRRTAAVYEAVLGSRDGSGARAARAAAFAPLGSSAATSLPPAV
jgi:glycosyltransferase involved in cell wall biosynthesis